MKNITFCMCSDDNSRKRNHHGVVCTKCNVNHIEPLLVLGDIKAYRMWNFNIESGFSSHRGSSQTWESFNTLPPPGIADDKNQDYMKPWKSKATCLYNNHFAPDPYCSCGYYSVKKFGSTGNSFSHNSTAEIIKNFERNVISPLGRLERLQQQAFAKLFFFSPAMKTLELSNFQILSEVALKGKIIDCEKGYRSEKIEVKKLFLLIDFFELLTISEQLGMYLDKDRAEAIHSTLVWLDFLNSYIKGVSKLYSCEFEMLVNVTKNNPIDKERDMGRRRMELIQEISYNLPPSLVISEYKSFEKDLYINERLRGIADTVVISNNLLKEQSLPDLEEMFVYNKSFHPNIDNQRLPRRLPISQTKFSTLTRFLSYEKNHAKDLLRQYQEKVFSFGRLYTGITKSRKVGFKSKLYLENYQEIKGTHTSSWFPVLHNYLFKRRNINDDEASVINKEIDEVKEYLENLFKKKG